MKLLLTGTCCIALLGLYLETSVPSDAGQQITSVSSEMKAVERSVDINLLPAIKLPAPVQKVAEVIAKPIKPLNLSLPKALSEQINQGEQLAINDSPKLDLSYRNDEPRIRYNAELVFDREKGEDITGGKVNIHIPFG